MRYASLAIVVLLSACGGSKPRAGEWQAPKQGKSERTVDDWTTADEDHYIALSCQNLVGADGEFRCDALAKAGLHATTCTQDFNGLRAGAADETQRHGFRLIVAGLSMAQSCDEVAATFRLALMSMRSRAPKPTSRTEGSGDSIVVCEQRDDGSFALNAEDVLRKRGLGDRWFSETVSSVAAPIEVCGTYGELSWLLRATCADGSKPWGQDALKAHAARRGSRAGMPRCGGPGPMIDLYEVPCPEKRYAVYMDMYECGPGEDLRRTMN
jgi:hypothetical protein